MNEASQVKKQLIQDFVQGAGKDFDIVRYCHLFLRHLWLIGLIVGAALVGTFAWLSRQPKEYDSRTVVLVEQGQRKVLSKMEEIPPENLVTEDYLNTVVQTLTSQSLMLRVALAVGLEKDAQLFPPQPAGKGYSDEAIGKAMRQRVTAALRHGTRLIDISVEDESPERAKEIADAVVSQFLRQTSEQQLSEGTENILFRVIEEPTASTVPVKPEKRKMMEIAFVFALIIGGVLVIILDSLDESLRSVDQAEQFLGLPALAIVPEKKGQKSFIPTILDQHGQRSRQAEAFRTVRASLSLLGSESSRRVFLFASALPAEGKSFCSVNTAVAFSVEGLRTIVVEADLRRPSLHRFFPGLADRNTPGLSDFLAGNEALDSVILTSPIENLSFLFAGRRPPNPAELLASKAFLHLIEALLERFDRIICDSAPINTVSDTLTLIAAVQHVCLVVRPEKTPKRAIARACHLVERAGGNLAGFILNRVQFKYGSGPRYYYDYGDKYYQEDKLEKVR
jgi:capsular exopolysaccharide synthesis family protein